MKKRTKIIATIGPASSSRETLVQMVRAGLDVVRLNLSHGTHDEHAAVVRTIRGLEKSLQKPIGILADLGGPKIRTGALHGGAPLQLKRGDAIVFAPEEGAKADEIPITYPKLAADVRPGSVLLLDDGAISVEVSATSKDRIIAKVVDGGILRDHKGINLPGLVLSTGAITPKDERDLSFALAAGVDFIGVSFVQDAGDIERVRGLMKKARCQRPIIAKIERQIAAQNLEEIMAAADAAMVARGDLGVETPIEDVPILQKRIISLCARLRKPVVVATQMLESMIHNERPTRAEVTDVSNAVFEGADVVMLSAETSVGCDPANAVAMMSKIIRASEESPYNPHLAYLPDDAIDSVAAATSRAACFVAEDTKAKAICVFTLTGASAQFVSSQRPCAAIIAISGNEETMRRVQISWGVEALKIREQHSIDAMLTAGIKAARQARMIRTGDIVVVVCGTTTVTGATNMIKVVKV